MNSIFFKAFHKKIIIHFIDERSTSCMRGRQLKSGALLYDDLFLGILAGSGRQSSCSSDYDGPIQSWLFGVQIYNDKKINCGESLVVDN